MLWTDSLYQVGKGFQSWVPYEAWLSSQEFTKRILDVRLSEAHLAAPAELSSKYYLINIDSSLKTLLERNTRSILWIREKFRKAMPFHKSHDAAYLHLTEKNVILSYYYVSVNINIIPPSWRKKCILRILLDVYVHKYDSNPLV
jgi:hypothetical protein